MTEYLLHEIIPERDLPTLNDRILRLPWWRSRRTLSYPRDIDRLQSALAYDLLERLLRRCFSMDLSRLVVEYSPTGRPAIAGHPEIWFSLSHCPMAVMAVVSDSSPVGCDVEAIPLSHPAEVEELYYSQGERRLIELSADPSLEFTRIWTVKEALFKLDNSLDIESLDTTAFPGVRVITERIGECVASVAGGE